MGTFEMYTGEVLELGSKVSANAEEFGTARKKIDDTVNRIYNSELKENIGEAAFTTIRSYNGLLDRIQSKLDSFGQNAVNSARNTAALSEEIASQLRKNQM